VSIDAVDPNGNYIHLADATTDMSGTYSAMVKPDTAGQYIVYVTFGGSSGYYGSYATTGLGVEQGPESTPQPSTAMSMTDQYFLPIAGIIIVIAIIGVILSLLALRRHP
jgi:hypothetical protein